jgi:hypothetical protein
MLSRKALSIAIATVLGAVVGCLSTWQWARADLPETWEVLRVLASHCAGGRDIQLTDDAWFTAQAIADEWYAHSRRTRVVIGTWEFRLALEVGTGEVVVVRGRFVGGEIDSEGADVTSRDFLVVAKPLTILGRLRVLTGIYRDPGLRDP